MGAMLADAPEMTGMRACGFRRHEPDIDLDTGVAQFRVALPRDFRIRILDRRHHALDARGNHGIGARRRLPDMRTGLERHIKRGAARRRSGLCERDRLRMRTATRLGPAAPDNDAVLDDDRADSRVRPGASEAAPAERQRQVHKAAIRRP